MFLKFKHKLNFIDELTSCDFMTKNVPIVTEKQKCQKNGQI